MALNGLFCADVPLRNYSLTHPGGGDVAASCLATCVKRGDRGQA